MTIRLKEARKLTGMTQDQASKRSGIPLGTLRRWEQGVNEPDIDSIILLAKMYNTSTDFILGSKFSGQLGSTLPAPFVEVPLFGSIAAGSPIDMESADIRYMVPADVHSRYPEAFLLRIEGRSMSRILPDGCYALVDPCTDVAYDNDPYAVCVNGYSATVKRIRKLANGFELAPDSDDPTFRPKVYDFGEEGTDEITVIGRVVWYCIPADWSF